MQPLVETEGAGPHLALLAGTLTGWQSWARALPGLRKNRTVTRIQPLRSQLATATVPVPPGYGPAAEQAAIDAAFTGIDDLDLVGWAAGGREALTWATRHPGRVRRLTLVEPTCFGLLDPSALAPEAAEALEGLRRLLDRAAARGEVEEADVAEYADRSAMTESGEPPATHFRWPDWNANRRALAFEPLLMTAGPTAGELRNLDVSTRLVLGDRTAAHHRALVEELGRLLPEAETVELTGGHACHLEELDAFCALIAP